MCHVQDASGVQLGITAEETVLGKTAAAGVLGLGVLPLPHGRGPHGRSR